MVSRADPRPFTFRTVSGDYRDTVREKRSRAPRHTKMKLVWSILLGLLLIDATVAIKALLEHLHNKPSLLDIIPKPPKLPGISIQVGQGSFGFGFGFGGNKPPRGNDHGKPDHPGTWDEKEGHRPGWGGDKDDRHKPGPQGHDRYPKPHPHDHEEHTKPGPHGHDRYPEPHPHDQDRYPKPHPDEHDGHMKPGPHGHDRYPKPHPHDDDRYPKPHPHDHDRYPDHHEQDRYPKPRPGQHDRYPKPRPEEHDRYPKPRPDEHDKYPNPDETFEDKEYPKHEKDRPRPGHNKEYPKREDKDSLPDWEDIGESDSKSESLMESDLVGDGLIQPRKNKRDKRYIESRIYHVPLMFRSNGLPFKVKIESGRRNMLRK